MTWRPVSAEAGKTRWWELWDGGTKIGQFHAQKPIGFDDLAKALKASFAD